MKASIQSFSKTRSIYQTANHRLQQEETKLKRLGVSIKRPDVPSIIAGGGTEITVDSIAHGTNVTTRKLEDDAYHNHYSEMDSNELQSNVSVDAVDAIDGVDGVEDGNDPHLNESKCNQIPRQSESSDDDGDGDGDVPILGIARKDEKENLLSLAQQSNGYILDSGSEQLLSSQTSGNNRNTGIFNI